MGRVSGKKSNVRGVSSVAERTVGVLDTLSQYKDKATRIADSVYLLLLLMFYLKPKRSNNRAARKRDAIRYAKLELAKEALIQAKIDANL